MTKAEMNRRIAEMSPETFRLVVQMIGQGYGAFGISLESPATLKQANAVFEYERRRIAANLAAPAARLADWEG